LNIAVLLHSTAGGSGVVAIRLTDITEANVFFHKVQHMNYPLFSAPLTTLAEASKLTEVVEEFDIDIVHAHYAVPHATAALMAKDMIQTCKTCKIPGIVTTLHGTDVTLVGLDSAYLRTTQYSVEKSDVTTAVSQYLADYTRSEMGVQKEIHVVPNAVDSKRFLRKANPELRQRYAHPDEKLLIHISNFREVKRTPDVIKVFAKVAEVMGARLLMIGDGPERQDCLQLSNELHLGGRVSFLGSFPRVEELLAIGDLFLLPSAKESFGLVALEAMACGLPVVASNIGGIPEVVVHDETGYMHDLGDVEGMAESAIRILKDAELHERLASSGRARAETTFSETSIVPMYEAIYQKALEIK